MKKLDHIQEVRVLIESYGIAEVARLLGTTERGVAYWVAEEGAKVPRKETIAKIHELFVKHVTVGSISDKSGISTADKVKAFDALLAVLISDYAAWKGQQTGENPEVIARRLYKAAEDVQLIG